MKLIQITSEPLDPHKIELFMEGLSTEHAVGAIVNFIGTVRNSTRDRAVKRLDFEAYEPMALLEMAKIAEQAKVNWPVQEVVIHHRVGTLTIGEIPVIISVCSAHREAAFKACQFCIDTLKQTVPIWKKEIFEDGEEWVSPTP